MSPNVAPPWIMTTIFLPAGGSASIVMMSPCFGADKSRLLVRGEFAMTKAPYLHEALQRSCLFCPNLPENCVFLRQVYAKNLRDAVHKAVNHHLEPVMHTLVLV